MYSSQKWKGDLGSVFDRRVVVMWGNEFLPVTMKAWQVFSDCVKVYNDNTSVDLNVIGTIIQKWLGQLRIIWRANHDRLLVQCFDYFRVLLKLPTLNFFLFVLVSYSFVLVATWDIFLLTSLIPRKLLSFKVLKSLSYSCCCRIWNAGTGRSSEMYKRSNGYLKV
jgi:hypothetical protein